MKILLRYKVILYHFIFIYYIIYTECVGVFNNGNKSYFTNTINKNKLSFINSCYSIQNSLKSNVLYNEYRLKLQDKDDTVTHSDHFSQVPKTETNTVYKTPNIKTLVLTRSSELKANLVRFVKRVKESKGYEVLSDGLVKVKNRLNNLKLYEQFGLLAFGSYVCTFFLPKFRLTFPYQLFPTDSPVGLDIGLDTLVSIPFIYTFVKDFKFLNKKFELPNVSVPRLTLVFTSTIVSFLLSGHFSAFIDSVMFIMSAFGYPVSTSIMKSVSMFSSHMFWFTIGSLVLHNVLFPVTGKENPWYNADLNKQWVYKVLSGFLNSSFVFKFSDFTLQTLKKFFDVTLEQSPIELVITDICESDKLLPIFMTFLASCITAPWWEELIYRVLTLRTLNMAYSELTSVIVSSLLFSLNHMSFESLVPLFSIGVLWSMIHIKENNIFINFLIHSIWNIRVFLLNFFENH